MPVVAVIGAQWGDEGKGSVVDFLAQEADVVVRFQGGANAGHTVVYRGQPLALHLLPCGIIHERPLSVLANGVVVDVSALLEEIAWVTQRGVSVTPARLKISDRAHITLPYHRLLDGFREMPPSRSRLGTTQKGVGPTYVDKIDRTGIRFADFTDLERLKSKIAFNWEQKVSFGDGFLLQSGLTADSLFEELVSNYEKLKDFAEIMDTVPWLNRLAMEGKRILLEGAQGTGLDADHGTYPFVTSSNTTAGGACTGTGLPPSRITKVLGVAKAYTTRVGEGPFPTEMPWEQQADLRERGREYGATTGRPRRCGWFDAVLVRHACLINGFSGLVLTKLDILTGLPTVRLATAYRWQGRFLEFLPADSDVLAQCEPVYEEMDGWLEPIGNIRRWQDLPSNAQRLVDRIVELTGVPIAFVSVGPERDAILFPDGGGAIW
ncbi:MAG: adenylosuccinate synthase [Armatimonadetes bacterium]|nr:adenylosuccinate synthase [Armatimonadota bacterium]MDW8122873.1 adenylosuccinate synthase [Armatimonadota bacterium]